MKKRSLITRSHSPAIFLCDSGFLFIGTYSIPVLTWWVGYAPSNRFIPHSSMRYYAIDWSIATLLNQFSPSTILLWQGDVSRYAPKNNLKLSSYKYFEEGMLCHGKSSSYPIYGISSSVITRNRCARIAWKIETWMVHAGTDYWQHHKFIECTNSACYYSWSKMGPDIVSSHRKSYIGTYTENLRSRRSFFSGY